MTAIPAAAPPVPATITITLEPFGPARAWLGPDARAIVLDAPRATPEGLLARLAAEDATFAPRAARCAVARGDALLPRHAALADGDVLALIPPVSGG